MICLVIDQFLAPNMIDGLACFADVTVDTPAEQWARRPQRHARHSASTISACADRLPVLLLMRAPGLTVTGTEPGSGRNLPAVLRVTTIGSS